jgi:putative transposase
MRTSARTRYAGYRFPAEIIGHGVWLYFRFPLGLRMVEELLAARGIIVSHETVRQWARKFGQQFANQIRRRLPRVGDKWHLDEVVLSTPRCRQSGAGQHFGSVNRRFDCPLLAATANCRCQSRSKGRSWPGNRGYLANVV